MARTSGRRFGGQYSRRRDEEYGRDEGATDRADSRGQNANSLIADMAKGFVEAQAKIATPSADGANQEMLALLEKISRQLAELKTSPAAGGENATGRGDRQGGAGGGQGQTGQHAGPALSQQNGQQAGRQVGQQAELSAIFSQLLSNGKGDGAAQQKGGGQQSATSGSGQQGGQPADARSVTARTAAQALAQAQYELANELEASLTKLKQVISESEKLADRISNLLGQESGSRQT